MNHQKLIGYSIALLCGCIGHLSAQEQPAKNTNNAMSVCTQEFLVSYFPRNIVENTLNKFNVPQEKQELIIQGLADSEKNIIPKVEEKASKITPNPLRDPQQRQVAVKVFRETLMDVFSGVLYKNNINDPKQIQSMLEDIQQQKAEKFAECLKQKQQQRPPAEKAPEQTEEPKTGILPNEGKENKDNG